MQFLDLKKNLKKNFSTLRPVKVAVLGDTSTQFLTQATRGYGYQFGLNLEVFEADYDQIDRQIMDNSSDLHRAAPDFVIIFQATQKLLKRFYATAGSDRANFGRLESERIERWTRALVANLPKTKIITLNFPELDDAVFGNYANKTAISFLYQLRRLNLDLMQLAQTTKNLSICDVAVLQGSCGAQMAFAPRLYIEADMVFSLDFLPILAKSIIDIIRVSSGFFKKALIMDLDNTLWGGVIGDDGIEGIQIGELGQGKAFTELQKWVLQLKQRGILLAICSKNDAQLAREPFEKHSDMELSLDDIAMFVANWDSKVDNIRSIQAFFNIGFDSMVFPQRWPNLRGQ